MFSYGVEWDSKFREIRNPLETISGFIKNVSYVNPFAADLVGNSKFVSHIGLGARQSAALELRGISGLGAKQILRRQLFEADKRQG